MKKKILEAQLGRSITTTRRLSNADHTTDSENSTLHSGVNKAEKMRLLVLLLALAGALNYEGTWQTHSLPLVDTIIVGAGGAGLQAAVLLSKRNMSYVVLEASHSVGSFWHRFPVFEQLISINKRVRNSSQAWRFDWHSLLEAQSTMHQTTKRFFPLRSDLSTYFARIVEEQHLHVLLGVRVSRIAPTSSCVVLHGGVEFCARKRVLVGTGLVPKEEPILQAMGGVPYSQFKRHFAHDRRVCILGNGNSGFEIAQNIYDVAERVTLYGKRPFRLSAVTRYTGDVRTKLIQVLENLHGKLLDTVSYFETLPQLSVSGLDMTKEQELDLRLTLTKLWTI